MAGQFLSITIAESLKVYITTHKVVAWGMNYSPMETRTLVTSSKAQRAVMELIIGLVQEKCSPVTGWEDFLMAKENTSVQIFMKGVSATA